MKKLQSGECHNLLPSPNVIRIIKEDEMNEASGVSTREQKRMKNLNQKT
jgi:hypothetical protein